MYAKLEPRSGTWEVYEEEATLETLQLHCEGYVERLMIGRFILWFNEEGRLQQLEPSLVTVVSGTFLTLVGPIVVTRFTKDGNFDVAPLTDDDVDLLERIHEFAHAVVGEFEVPMLIGGN